MDKENEGENEILVPKKNLTDGIKVGDECTFRATQDFGDEMAFEYVKEGESPKGEQTNDNLNATTENEISALDQKE